MSQERFVDVVVKECPEARRLVEARIREWDGEIVLHVIVADLRRLVLAMFEAHETEALSRCLGVVATGLIHGDGNVHDAVAVSFVEGTPWWDTRMLPFIASWPVVLQAESERRRPITVGTTETGKPIFVIDGSRFLDFEGFAREISPWIDRDTWWYGYGNLDAFDDVLAGGYGTPDCGFVIRWIHSDLSRSALGHGATEQWLKRRLVRSRVGYSEDTIRRLDDARHGRGPTLFDYIVDIIRGWGPGGIQPDGDIELYLE